MTAAPDGASVPPAEAAPGAEAAGGTASPFVLVGGDAAACEGDVCAVPAVPEAGRPLASAPTT